MCLTAEELWDGHYCFDSAANIQRDVFTIKQGTSRLTNRIHETFLSAINK
jgi:hypothetical protein